jgi:hypothetical protein
MVIGEWISVEHNEEWAAGINGMNTNERVHINFVKPNRYPWTDKYNDGAYSDLKEYVNFPKGKFDFILVDGRARKDCLVKANRIVRSKGVVVLHDANRKHYHGSFKLYKHRLLFEDSRRNGGLWIGSNGSDIGALLDIEKHKAIWKMYASINRPIGGKGVMA